MASKAIQEKRAPRSYKAASAAFGFRVRKVVIALLATLLVLTGLNIIPSITINTPAEAASTETVGSRYGAVQSHFMFHDAATQDRELSEMEEAGIKWLRFSMTWCDMEFTQGDWNFELVDRAVEKAHAHGINILAIIGGAPPWANGGQPWMYPPTDIPAWRNYVRTVCSRYRGRVSAWEIGNEENTYAFWMPAPDANAFVALVRETTPEIRAAAPEATIVMGGVAGLDPGYLEACFKAGILDYVDAVAYHPYPETLQFMNYTPQEWNCRYIVNWLRWLISTYTSKHVQIWLTELGWTTCTYFPPGVDEQTQASYMTRTFINYAGLPVDKVFYYNLYQEVDNPHDGEYNLGLLTKDFRRKPAYNYYRTFEEVFGRAVSKDTDVAGFTCSNPYSLEAHCFNLDDGSLAIAVWKSDDQNDSLTIKVNNPAFEVPVTVDPLTGQEQATAGVTRDAAGKITVSGLAVGKNPVIIKLNVPGAPPAGAISATVKKEGGEVLSGCSVEAYSAAGGSLAGGSTTNSSGQCTIGNLPAGSYKLRFTDSAGVYTGEYYHDRSALESADAVSVTAGSTVAIQETLAASAPPLAPTPKPSPEPAPAPVPPSEAASTWYLAEGCTTGEFDTWVLVQNPGSEDAQVTLEFQLPPGQSAKPYTFVLPARSRKSVLLDSLPGLASADVSTKVTADRQVIAERSIYFDYNGIKGGHETLGVTAPANEWYLAEGYTGGFFAFDTWVLVQNPGSEDATVTFDFQLPSPYTAAPYTFTLPARTRKSVMLDTIPGLNLTEVSTKVTSTKPVVAERSMYFDYGGRREGNNSVGVTAPATTWYMAEGCTSAEYETWILVQNPNKESTKVTLDFQLPAGQSAKRYSFTLKGYSRRSVMLDELPGLAAADVSTKVTAAKPVVAERATYFNYNGKKGGTESMGVTSPASTWYLAEGCTAGEFDTWVLVQNPNSREATVTVEFQLPPGQSASPYTFNLPAKTRKSISLDALPGLASADVSAKVTSTKPVIAERSMYFDYNGKQGGHSSAGYSH